jgi:SRSO17 transposase
MTASILKRLPRFSNYLALFDTRFGQPARQHFLHLLLAFLIYDGAKNLTGLNRATFNRRHLSSVDRFLSEVEWDEAELEQLRFADLTRRARCFLKNQQAKGHKVPVFLCIDDTNNPKSGLQTLGVSPQYSHLQRRILTSYCLLTAVLVVGPWVIPYEFKLYRRREECVAHGQLHLFRDKLSLAAELIQQWQPFEQTQPFVLADGWYSGPAVLSACAERNFTLICGLPSNRSIKVGTEQAKPYLQLKHYQTTLSPAAYHSVTVVGRRWKLASVVAPLKSGRSGKVVLASEVAASKGERYWWCSDPKLSVAEIMEYYAVRWEIETFHKQAKQLLGWCDNQCHLPRTVRRLWTLLLIAYSYLTIERVEHSEEYPRWKGCSYATLWQIQQSHKLEAHQAQFEWAYEAGRSGVALQDLLGKVRA